MIPYTQNVVSSVDGTVRGSCFRTGVGCILEINPETMPHWEKMDNEWFMNFYKWLKEHGHEFHGTRYKPSQEELEQYEGVNGYYCVFGKSPREYVKSGHLVVFYKGKMVHDPHPSREGILTIDGFYMIEPISLG